MELFNLLFGDRLPNKRTQIEIKAKHRGLPLDHPDYFKHNFFSRPQGALNFATNLSAEGYDAYFGVAVRDAQVSPEGFRDSSKSSFAYTQAVWVDLDCDYRDCLPDFILPPTFVIHSGRNYHVYWGLQDPLRDANLLEEINRKLCARLKMDYSCADCVHVLRVPNTMNYKYGHENPLPVNVVFSNPNYLYPIEDIQRALSVPLATTKLVLNDVEQGSRSERDWAVVCDLVRAGLTTASIYTVFDYYPVGSKTKEVGNRYLDITIDNARKQAPEKRELTNIIFIDPPKPKLVEKPIPAPAAIVPISTPVESAIVVGAKKNVAGTMVGTFEQFNMTSGHNGYFKTTKKGDEILLSTWTFVIKGLHCNPANKETFLVLDVVQDKKVRNKDWVVSVTAFNGCAQFKKALNSIYLTWHGSDTDTSHLHELLLYLWKEQGMPTALLINHVGRYIGNFQGPKDLIVCSDRTFDHNGQSVPDIYYTPPGTECPNISFPVSLPHPQQYETVLRYLFQINREPVIYPAVGWFAATFLKPLLQRNNIKFPHLMVHGTRGSGKTTLITDVLQPLVGYASNETAQTWPASTTPFVLMTLCGSSSSTPICLSEYRQDSVNFQHKIKLLDLLRRAYDSGKDARGHANQTTTTYELTAPLCIDGEDPFTDAAVLERTITLALNVNDREEPCFSDALASLRRLPLRELGASLALYSLSSSIDIVTLWDTALELCTTVLTNKVSSRELNNIAVCVCGLLFITNFCTENKITCSYTLTAENILRWFTPYIEDTHDSESGHSRIAVDNFVESVVNYVYQTQAAPNGRCEVFYRLEPNVLGFHLATAYDWWASSARRRNGEVFEKKTIRRQLGERVRTHLDEPAHKYVKIIKNAFTTGGACKHAVSMCFIDLKLAQQAGLDIAQAAPRDTTKTQEILSVQDHKLILNLN